MTRREREEINRTTTSQGAPRRRGLRAASSRVDDEEDPFPSAGEGG
jgi:hypothetical protein